ncbi:hypothetical protein MKW98_011413 [Papaver atlanticum]|uniref:UBC core domain-containing protein n=1 Tax=Papaver atlanticum TaxID=357466 RepID=A0AAD4SKX0_9MAGN|nr:hypothetical protein MKW98_011413 [Papaver atlanticum]
MLLIIPMGTFKLSLQFSEDYPNKPPTVRFVSQMFHPNNGSICLDILQNPWSPIYDVDAILTFIQSFLSKTPERREPLIWTFATRRKTIWAKPSTQIEHVARQVVVLLLCSHARVGLPGSENLLQLN